MSTDKLFTPLKIGDLQLAHRVIMAPLTRYRAENYLPGSLMETYYSQRATPGGLLITEGTTISSTAGLHPDSPRIDTAESIESWRKVTNAVHDKGGYIFVQLNHCGRSALSKFNDNQQPISSSAIKQLGAPLNYEEDGLEFELPREMTEADMKNVISDFCKASSNAMEAGFDGIELHSANGYLLDQFLEDNINSRTDMYGGTIENRCRFVLQVIDAICSQLGSSKVGVRISPWDNFQGANDSDPLFHFGYLCEQLEKRSLAYVHIIEARSESNGGLEKDDIKKVLLSKEVLKSSIPPLKKHLPTTPVFSAGGWNCNNFAGILLETGIDGLAFGRYFISNPDLVHRLQYLASLSKYDRATFYKHLSPVGYIDYPLAVAR